ncbi:MULTISPECIES: ABC transporter substrate-binding protein [unclassified Microbacterium]|uniref:ABC transporter substrate-binding protein n=1 Tax=unclassified Microbacterium TaxID=2609290 RepID=UPI00214C8E17|nr:MULTISPECIES: ABC transporter substrate-binding protein [unclassified Microbacterium]MCR2811161.1 ABC transporter substrate-binding protein [Microbacterium sp. zg.B185]WIM20726.1 ABC transporter substrate-binding protein [Microbacterium sp. zg-B185]
MLALSACASGGASGADPSGDPGLTPVRLGSTTISVTACLQLGIERGTFEEHGLDVEYQASQSGAAIMPAVAAGQTEFGVSGPPTVLLAAAQGIDVVAVTGINSSPTEGPDAAAVVVSADSDIQSSADLPGHSVAVTTLNGSGALNIRDSVKKAGGDAEEVSFVEIGLPDMGAQLEAGTVDAVWTLEPFLGLLVEQGNRVVSYPSVEAIPGQPALVTFAARKYAEANPEVVKGFQEAVFESVAYCEENPDDYKDAIVRYVEMPADVVAAIQPEIWTPEIDGDLLQQIADQMLTYGVIDSELDAGDLFVSTK